MLLLFSVLSVSLWLIFFHGLSNASRMCRRSRAQQTARSHRCRSRRPARSRRDPAPRLRRRRARLALHHVKGCRFPMVSNLFGTIDRARFMFRDSLDRVAQTDRTEDRSNGRLPPSAAGTRARRLSALSTLPKFVSRADITANETTISQLPQQVSWPNDGGAFITLPAGLHRRRHASPAGATRTSACTASSSPATSTSPTAKSACTIKSTARSASTTPPPSAPASRFA